MYPSKNSFQIHGFLFQKKKKAVIRCVPIPFNYTQVLVSAAFSEDITLVIYTNEIPEILPELRAYPFLKFSKNLLFMDWVHFSSSA